MSVILSSNEQEVMELLWSEDRALTRTEIIDLSPNKSWKPSAIHVLLNSLLKKEMIQVAGFKPTGKNYGRTYAAAVDRAGYAARVLLRYLPKDWSTGQPDPVDVLVFLLHELQIDDESRQRLRRMLDQ